MDFRRLAVATALRCRGSLGGRAALPSSGWGSGVRDRAVAPIGSVAEASGGSKPRRQLVISGGGEWRPSQPLLPDIELHFHRYPGPHGDAPLRGRVILAFHHEVEVGFVQARVAHVHVERVGDVAVDRVEELAQVDGAVTAMHLADDSAGGDFQGREQRGRAVASVVVARLARAAWATAAGSGPRPGSATYRPRRRPQPSPGD